MAEQTMRNPFRSEEDAFRVLVVILVAAAIVIAAAVLISSLVGAILALVAISLGLWKTFGWLRVALREPEADAEPGADRPAAESKPDAGP